MTGIIFKTVGLISILFFASITDIRKLIVRPITIYSIIILSFIGISLDNIIAGVVLFAIFLICNLTTKSIGMGDVKLVGVCGLALGPIAYFGAFIAMLMAAILVPIITKLRHEKMTLKKEFPLVPYLAFGFSISAVINLVNLI